MNAAEVEGLGTALAPEVFIPGEAVKHAGTILMLPLVIISIVLIMIGLIVFSAAKSKVPGSVILLLGFLVGMGAFEVMIRSESKHS